MPFTMEEMKKRFLKFGTVYSMEDIHEEVEDIIGHEEKKELMADFFLSLKKYQEIAPQLKLAKITPNFTMLLYGPPGTGKTSLTRAMAKKYSIPLGVVEADRLVSPLLGDTVKNIRGVFDLAVDFVKENGVFILFFDEIDAVASERANAHEVGEIKRAVVSFLQIIDKISYDAVPLAIFGATNHQSQLDSAVWRRFTYHLSFDFPSYAVRKSIIESFIARIEKATIGIDHRLRESLVNEYDAINSKVEEKQQFIGRGLTEKEIAAVFNEVKELGKAGLLYHTQGYTGSDLMRAMRVALFKALQKSMLMYDDYLRSLVLVGGTQDHVEQSQKLMNGGAPQPSAQKIEEPAKKSMKSKKDLSKIEKMDIDI
jgi:SpoVK/Ycf46/Vps4 family AAA+-type ATPase